jgi:hypothetical protein
MDYKKYSLENLENWLHDAISSGEATPDEVYNLIVKVIREEYDYHKQHASQTYELLCKLNGNGKELYDAVMKEREYYEPTMPPWGHSDLEYLANDHLTKDRNSNFPGENTVCDKDDPSPECQKSWNDFWDDVDQNREYNLREAEYYDKRVQLDTEIEAIRKAGGYEYTPLTSKKDKVVKWQLPVEIDEVTEEYFVSFPDDLLNAASLKEGDSVEWVDNNDGSYTLRKV